MAELTTINPDPCDDYCNLSVPELLVEIGRGLGEVERGHEIARTGEAHAELALYALRNSLRPVVEQAVTV